MTMYNPLAGMSSVAPQGAQGRKLAPGNRGDGQIGAIKWQNSNNGQGLLFIVEYTCVRSTSPADPSGSPLSWVQPMSRNTAKPSVKAFLHAVMGLTNDVAAQQRLDAALHSNGRDSLIDWAGFYAGDEDNPLMGYYFSVETVNKPTQKKMDFNLHTFKPFNYAEMGWPVPNFDAFLQKAHAYQGRAPAPAPQQQQQGWNPQAAPPWQGQQQPPAWGPQPAPAPAWNPQAPPAPPAWGQQPGAPQGPDPRFAQAWQPPAATAPQLQAQAPAPDPRFAQAWQTTQQPPPGQGWPPPGYRP